MNHFDIFQAQYKAWSILSRSFKTGRVASTYLFHGSEGLGQWLLAVSFAALLNCSNPRKTDDNQHPFYPCGECRNCRNIYGLNFIGLFAVAPIGPYKKLDEAIEMTNEFVEKKRQEPLGRLSALGSLMLPIDMARLVKKNLSLIPDEGTTRVAIFYRMDKMLASSADALLKLIEEPPSGAVIILTAERPEALLPTIQSRAQGIKMDRVPTEVIVDYLMKKYSQEKSKALLIARISEGLPGYAVDMVAGEEDDESSRRSVGLLLYKTLLTESPAAMILLMDELIDFKNRSEVDNLLYLWQTLVRDCSYYAMTGDDQGLISIDFVPEIIKLSRYFGPPGVTDGVTEAIKNTLADLPLNVHIQMAMAALVLKIKRTIKSAPVSAG